MPRRKYVASLPTGPSTIMEVCGGDVALVRRVQAAVLGTGATGTMASFDSYDHVLRAAGYVRAPPSPGDGAIDVIPAAGDVDRVYTTAEAVALTRAEHDRLDALIEGLRCLVGFRRMDALLSGVNAFENALRNEMIARLIGAAADVRDWRIDAFIVPEADGANDDEEDADATS